MLRLMRTRGTWSLCPPKPLVSVIIPTHNRSKLLVDRALDSALKQTHENLEIIVAAHGCTDDTFWRVREIDDRRIKLIEAPRRETYPPTAENHWLAGPVAPLNAALKAVTGDWIARLDDDDIWTPDHVEKLLAFAREGNYEFVSSAHRTHESKIEPYRMPHSIRRKIDGEQWIIAEDILVGGVQTWLYRSYLKFMKYNPDCWRKTWNKVNDTDLQDRMWRAGVRMGYLDLVTAYVYPRPGEVDVGSKAYLRDKTAAERKFAF